MSKAIIEECEVDGIGYRVTCFRDRYRFQQRRGSIFETKLSVTSETFEELDAKHGLKRKKKGKAALLREIINNTASKTNCQVETLEKFFFKIGSRHSRASHAGQRYTSSG